MAGHSLGVTGFGRKGLASKAQEEGWGNPTKMNRFQVGELDSDFFLVCHSPRQSSVYPVYPVYPCHFDEFTLISNT